MEYSWLVGFAVWLGKELYQAYIGSTKTQNTQLSELKVQNMIMGVRLENIESTVLELKTDLKKEMERKYRD